MYKKHNFMLPVKTVIPPNNSLLFFPRWNIYENLLRWKAKKKYQIWYTATLRLVNLGFCGWG